MHAHLLFAGRCFLLSMFLFKTVSFLGYKPRLQKGSRCQRKGDGSYSSFRGEGALKASAWLPNPTGASQFLRSDISKLSHGALPAFQTCLSDSLFSKVAFETSFLSTLPCPRSVSGVHIRRGRWMGHSSWWALRPRRWTWWGGGYTLGNLNATCRLCKTQVPMLESSRHWSGLCLWLGAPVGLRMGGLAAGGWLGATHSFAPCLLGSTGRKAA